MRITQIMLGKGFGGAERSFVDTALALAERGYEVQAICHRKFVKRALLENIPNLQMECIPAGGQWDFMTPRRIARLIRRFQPEVVHTQLKRAAWHGGRGGHMAGVPVISKLHNYVDLERYRYVHTLVGTTEDQRRHALKLQWPEDRVAVIPNFSRVPPVEQAHALEARPLRLFACGRYVPVKGFDILLKAFSQLLDSGVDASLTIGGGGPDEAMLVQLTQDLGIADKVKLGVWVEDVCAALDQADVFVLSSRSESFGIVLLEAMARGVPIVSTRTKGPSQVLSDELAWLADVDSVESLAAALSQVSLHPNETDRKAAKALDLYRSTYHVSAVLPRLEELYRSVSSR